MANISTTAHELRNVDVRYISLVDRAANRMPFRIVKKDKSQELDLSQVFKGEKKDEPVDLTKIIKRQERPTIAGLIISNEATPEISEMVLESAKKSGLAIDKVTKGEASSVYAAEGDASDAHLFELAPGVVLAVKGFYGMSEGTFPEMVASSGFYAGLNGAMDVLYVKISEALMNSEDPKESASKVDTVVGDFGDYVAGLVKGLPAAAFKVDRAIREGLRKHEAQTPAPEKESQEVTKADMKCPKCGTDMDAIKGGMKCPKCGDTIMQKADEVLVSKEDRAIAAKAFTGSDAVGWDHLSDAGKDAAVELFQAAKKKEAAPAVAAPVKEEATKNDDTLVSILDTLKNLTQKLEESTATQAALATKVDELTTAQAEQKKVVDGVVQKAETLGNAVSGTVAAAAALGDTPKKETTQKAEDTDPRTGCFDTAMISRSFKRDRPNRY